MGHNEDIGGVEVRRSPDGQRVAVLLEVGPPGALVAPKWIAVYVTQGQLTMQIMESQELRRWDEPVGWHNNGSSDEGVGRNRAPLSGSVPGGDGTDPAGGRATGFPAGDKGP